MPKNREKYNSKISPIDNGRRKKKPGRGGEYSIFVTGTADG